MDTSRGGGFSELGPWTRYFFAYTYIMLEIAGMVIIFLALASL